MVVPDLRSHNELTPWLRKAMPRQWPAEPILRQKMILNCVSSWWPLLYRLSIDATAWRAVIVRKLKRQNSGQRHNPAISNHGERFFHSGLDFDIGLCIEDFLQCFLGGGFREPEHHHGGKSFLEHIGVASGLCE